RATQGLQRDSSTSILRTGQQSATHYSGCGPWPAGTGGMPAASSLLEFLWFTPWNGVCAWLAALWSQQKEAVMNSTIHVSLDTPARDLLAAGGVIADRQSPPPHLELYV